MPAHAFYRFFTGDYLRDAGHLSLLEHGAYRRLIDLYMIEAGPLPFDMPRLYRLLHATSKEEQQAVQVVVEEFFRMDGMVLRHARCDRELQWQRDTSETARRNVMKREELRKQRLANDRSSPDVRAIIEPEPEPEPLKEKDKQASPAGAIRPPPCPVSQIIDGYNRLVPSGIEHRVRTDTRQGHITARWRQVFKDKAASGASEGLQFFHDFFERVEASRFLSGNAKPSAGNRPFRVSLDWLMKPDNFAKVIEGKYDDELHRQT